MNKNFKQTSKTGSLAWLLQRLSAVLLFVLLLFHFIVYHFISQGRTDYLPVCLGQGPELVVPAAAVRCFCSPPCITA